jgi:hypothetical protein
MRRYEFHNCKTLFRSALLGGHADPTPRLYMVSSDYAREQVSGLSSPEDVVAFYEGGSSGRAVREAWEVYQSMGQDLSFFELALDRSYVRLLWDAAKHVGPCDGGRLRDWVLVPWLSSTAVMWTLWLARYRGTSVEEATTLLALPTAILSPGQMAELFEKREPSAVADGFRNLKLREFLSGADLPKDPIGLHRQTRRFAWQLAASARVKTRVDVATLLAALIRWEIIVEDAVTVTGAKALGMKNDEIEPLLATRAA